MEKEFKGVWIPKEIYLNKDLNWAEKILLIEIGSLDRDGRGCFASNKHLSVFLMMSEGSVANMIVKLTKMGYLIKKDFDGRKRYISLNSDLTNLLKQTSQIYEGSLNKNMNAGFTNLLKQTSQKSEHSNTYSNTVINSINKENAELKNSTPKPEKKKKEKVEDCEYYFEFHQVISYLSNKTGATYRIPESLPKFLKYQPYTLIKTLFKENYNYEQINKVINDKCDEWLNDPKMCVYLKPDTLFRKSNFEKYLIAIEIKLKNKPKPQIQTYNNDKPKYVPKPLIIKSV